MRKKKKDRTQAQLDQICERMIEMNDALYRIEERTFMRVFMRVFPRFSIRRVAIVTIWVSMAALAGFAGAHLGAK